MKERRYEVVEKIYDFDELTEEAKENARREYLESFRCAEDYQTFCEDDLVNNYFPNSDLNVQFSLSSCQGDGFNIYGKMDIKDAVNYVLDNLSKIDFKLPEILKEKSTIRFLKWIANNGYTLYLSENKAHYSYCYVKYSDFLNTLYYDLMDDGYTANEKKHFEILTVFEKVLKLLIEQLCSDYESEGYKYFYEIEDEEIKDIWEANGYEGFYEDGTPCYL